MVLKQVFLLSDIGRSILYSCIRVLHYLILLKSIVSKECKHEYKNMESYEIYIHVLLVIECPTPLR